MQGPELCINGINEIFCAFHFWLDFVFLYEKTSIIDFLNVNITIVLIILWILLTCLFIPVLFLGQILKEKLTAFRLLEDITKSLAGYRSALLYLSP